MEGVEPSRPKGRRCLRPVRLPRFATSACGSMRAPPEPASSARDGPQAWIRRAARRSYAASRGGCRSGRAASRRALRRTSRTITFAARSARTGRGGTSRTTCRCRCISVLLSVSKGAQGRPPSGSRARGRGWSHAPVGTAAARGRTTSRSRGADRLRAFPCGRETSPLGGVTAFACVGPRRGRGQDHVSNPPGFEPGPARLELAVPPVTPRACEACVPSCPTSVGHLKSDVTQGRRCRTEVRHPGDTKPPAGFEPAPRPYNGRVLAVDTT
jgi:hypothetical protein